MAQPGIDPRLHVRGEPVPGESSMALYFIYHNGGLFTGGSFRRSVCVEYLNYNADGSIQKIFETTEGVTQSK